MKYFIFVFLALSLKAYAQPQALTCLVHVNSTLDSKEVVTVVEGGSASFGHVQGFKLKINSHPDHNFEIEAFDANLPARSYAEGKIKTQEDHIKWSYWSRESLIEAHCQLTLPSTLLNR